MNDERYDFVDFELNKSFQEVKQDYCQVKPRSLEIISLMSQRYNYPQAKITDSLIIENSRVIISLNNGVILFLDFQLLNGQFVWQNQTRITLQNKIDLSLEIQDTYPLLRYHERK